MPIITLVFYNPLNVSVQIGDTAYYCNTVTLGSGTTTHKTGITDVAGTPNFDVNASGARGGGGNSNTIGSDIIEMGPIVGITRWNGTQASIDVDWLPVPAGSPLPNITPPSFILFSKDNKTNLSTILGYYAEVEFRNDSTNEGELFSVGTSIFESSK